jgi:hypothetical protein
MLHVVTARLHAQGTATVNMAVLRHWPVTGPLQVYACVNGDGNDDVKDYDSDNYQFSAAL